MSGTRLERFQGMRAPGPTRRSRRTIGAALALSLAAALLWLALVLPNRPAALHPAAFAQVPLELPALLGAALALAARPRLARLFHAAVAGLLTVLVLLKAADQAIHAAFSRPFDPVIDMVVFPAGLNLLTGTLGAARALAVVALAVAAAAGLAWLIWIALRRWSRPALPRRWRRAAGATAVAFAALTVADAGRALGWALPADPPGAALTTRLAARHVVQSRAAARELEAFRAAAATDPWAGARGLFDLLGGRDVVVVFVESYGRTSFDTPLYATTHIPTLDAAAADLGGAGLAARSFWLTSPIAGGQSWLAHGTFASGLRTGDQASYGAMLASRRRTLYHLARDAGYRTAAVMPAITLPWPEGRLLGFDTVLDAADMDYAGLPFNWVTMPDQYTLAAFPGRLGRDPRPDFVQIALISSHAPWTPVPRMIDWDAAGDGRAFDAMARSGASPREVWEDRGRVRDHYRRAVDYALRATLSFAARQAGPDAPLMIVLGDHQPAPFVARSDSRDVPVHVIGPPAVLARLDGWAATPGLVPDADAPVWPMAAFRDRLVAAFTSPREGA